MIRSIEFTGMRPMISRTSVFLVKRWKNCRKLSVWTVMEKGALGYVTKAADDSELLLAIGEVSRGKVYIQQSVVRGITVTSNQLVVM